MALDKLPFTVNVASLRQDVDPHVLGPNAGMLQLRNVVMNQAGALTKRRGAAGLTGQVAPTGAFLPPVWQLATHKGALVWLSKVGDHPLATCSLPLVRWTYPTSETMRGPLSVRSIRWGRVAGGSLPETPDIAISGNLACVVYESPGANLCYEEIVDLVSGKTLYKATIPGILPQVLSIGGFFVVITANFSTGLFQIDRWNVATLSTVGAPASTTSAAGTNILFTFAGNVAIFDIVANGGNSITIAYQKTDNTVWTIDYTPSTNTAAAQAQFKDQAAANVSSSKAIGWIVDAAGTGQRILLTGDTNLRGHLLATSTTTTTTTVLDAAPGTVKQITGVTVTSANYNVFYGSVAGSFDIVKVAKNIGGVVTLAVFQRSVGLQSRAFLGPDGMVYAAFYLPSDTQGSYFVMPLPTDPTGAPQTAPVARFLTWRGTPNVGFLPPSHLSRFVAYGGEFIGPFVSHQRLESSAATPTYFTDAISLIVVGFNATAGTPAEAADKLFVPGATLNAYDAREFLESDFHVFPVVTGISAAAGGALVVGQTYEFIGVYRWTDAQGRVVRSATSLPVSVTIAPGDNAAALTATTDRLLSTRGTSVTIEWYRTTGNNGTFYKEFETANNAAVDAATASSIASDAALVAGELLYAQPGGELEFQPPPPIFAIIQFGGRLFGINSEDRRHLPFTTQFIPGEAPRWNEALDIVLDDQYGDMTGFAAMDDKLIIFKKDAIYVLTGDGPDINGNGSYRPPRLIAVGYGMDASQVLSVVTTIHGVWFMGPRGVCLLKRDLSIEFIGSPVGGPGNLMYNYICTGAAHVATQGHIRWFAANDVCICYDYDHQLWSTFDKDDTQKLETDAVAMWATPSVSSGFITAVDAGKPILVRAYSGVLVGFESPNSVFEQQGVTMTMSVTFPWLALAGLNGYERLYRIQGVGSVVTGTNGIRVTIAYDYNDADASATQVITPAAPNWLWDARPLRPLARAFKVKVQEGPGAADAGFTIAGLTFIVGAKKGLKRLAPTARAV